MKIYSGGPLTVPEKTLAQTFFDVAAQNPDRVGYRIKEGGRFTDYTYRQVADQVRTIGNAFLSLGVKKDDKVAILSETRGAWSLADYGILSVGGVTVTVYPTLAAEQIAYLLNDSTTKVLVVENAQQFEKIKKVAKDIKTVQTYVTIDDVADTGDLAKQTMAWGQLLEAGRTHAAANPNLLQERLAAGKPDDLATFVYTSGTTGTPKGAVLTHRNFISAYKSAQKALGLAGFQTTVLFLPLAHCYGRLVVFMIVDLAGSISFSAPSSLGEDLRGVKPSLVASVPRLYERMYDQIQNGVAQQPANKQKVFRKAEAVAKDMGRAKANGGSPGLMLRIKWAIFDKLVYSKLRERLGMTNLKIGFTGAAAIRPELLYFFQGIGVNILEGYGLTETAAPSNVNKPTKYKPGTVGPPFPGMEMRLDPEGIEQIPGQSERGEILMKGPNIFKGYYNLAGETADSFSKDGWFRTGDIGVFDADGYLKIVDRKKELEVLDTGKKIAPITVEEMLKTVSPLVSEACLIATGQKFAGCLVQPNFDRLVPWAKEKGIPIDASKVVVKPDPTGSPMTYAVGEDLLRHPDVVRLYEGEIAKCNAKVAEFERIKVFRLVPNAFTMDRDELTPTLKKKRRVITKNYAGLISEMFSR